MSQTHSQSHVNSEDDAADSINNLLNHVANAKVFDLESKSKNFPTNLNNASSRIWDCHDSD